jgi:hypothetical protein
LDRRALARNPHMKKIDVLLLLEIKAPLIKHFAHALLAGGVDNDVARRQDMKSGFSMGLVDDD